MPRRCNHVAANQRVGVACPSCTFSDNKINETTHMFIHLYMFIYIYIFVFFVARVYTMSNLLIKFTHTTHLFKDPISDRRTRYPGVKKLACNGSRHL